VTRVHRTPAAIAACAAAVAMIALALPGLHDRLAAQMGGQAIAVAVVAPLFAATVPSRRRWPAVACLAAFAAATVVLHLPASLRLAVARPWVHGVAMAFMLGAAVLLFRPLVGADPTARLPGPARLPYAVLAMAAGETMGFTMMAADPAWRTAAAVMMAGSVAIGLIGLAATWSWLAGELEEGTDG
jgi:cytochrome c oxidase assembly factor CtaG